MAAGVLVEVELEDTKILWPGGVLYGGGETYENVFSCPLLERRDAQIRTLIHAHLESQIPSLLISDYYLEEFSLAKSL